MGDGFRKGSTHPTGSLVELHANIHHYPKYIKAFYMRVNDDGRTVLAVHKPLADRLRDFGRAAIDRG